MSKLFLYKQYLSRIFAEKYKLIEMKHLTGQLALHKPRTTLDTYWLIYLSAYVNELAVPQGNEEEDDSEQDKTHQQTGRKYRGPYFNGLTLTYSTVGELPAEVNYYYSEKQHLLENAKRVFASYMVLLGSNQQQNKLHVNAPPDVKATVVGSFETLFAFLKQEEPTNPMLVIFDVCQNAVTVNESGMLTFETEQVVEVFRDYYGIDLTRCGLKSEAFGSKIEGVDILHILKKTDSLLPEDLLYFETELETGDQYDYIYVKKCKDRIAELRASNRPSSVVTAAPESGSVYMKLSDLNPFAESAPQTEDERDRLFFADVVATRNSLSRAWNEKFRSLIENAPFITADFIRKQATQFEPRELNQLLMRYDMGEDFLEQYFDSLDPAVIACHQHFSESFFMKHFQSLNYINVLKKGVNDWRLKENRSSTLSVFLRLKGIQD